MAMAKDGTARGGARIGAGRKGKALSDKLEDGESGITVLSVPEDADLYGEDVPEPSEYLKARQKDGGDFIAEEIYRQTWVWLKARGCEKLVNKQLIEQYAMSVGRWIQCEEAVTKYGFLSKHPTTGNAIASPYVSMAQSYMKQTNQLWYQIYQIVKENSLVEYQSGTPQDDVMERLLRARKG